MPLENRLPIILSLALAILGSGACKSLGFHGSGKSAPASPPLTGFDSVELAGGLTAEIAVGDDFEVAIEGDPALVRQIEAHVEEQTLVVARATKATRTGGPVRVRIALPALGRLQADACRVTVTGAAGKRLEVAAHGGSTVNVAGIDGDRLVLEATGGSRLVVAGKTDSVAFSLADASRGDGRELKARTAKVTLAGASRLDLRAQQAVSGEASGASKLAVWSKPKRIGVATRDASTVTYVR
jgi:hypothetical protein